MEFSKEALREQRARTGWTRSELAPRAKVSHSAIRDLEQGAATVPSANTLAKLADALGCKMEMLFKLEEPTDMPKEDESC